VTFSIRLFGRARPPLALASILLGAAAVRGAEPSRVTAAPSVVAPFVYEEARLYMPVKAAESALGDFILDSGSSHVVIDTKERAAAGVTVASRSEARGAGTAALALGHASGVALEVAGAPLSVEATEVADIDRTLGPYTGHPIGGIIGAAFFRRYVVTIDFQNSVLELRDPASFAYRGPGVRLPMHLVDDVPVISGALVMPDGSILPSRLLVDLGAKANLLVAGPFVDAQHLLQRLTPSVVEPLGAGVGGKTRYAFTRLAGIKLGQGRLPAPSNLIIGLSVGGTLRGGSYDAILGTQFLHRYRVTFDYSRRELILEPVRVRELDSFDRSGAFLIGALGDPHRIVAEDIAPGTPAAEAGLAEGDVLTAIDGAPTQNWTLVSARRRLASTTAPVVTLQVERSGRTLPLTLHLRALL